MEKKNNTPETTTTAPKGLLMKLVEVQRRVRGLGKDKDAGASYGKKPTYSYVSGSKVLDHIRPAMDELNLLLVPKVVSMENTRMDYGTKNGDKTEILTTVMVNFTWVDAESGETMEVPFGANGMNGFDKGLGSALTYAERYFLLKFFHIATDEDDVDALATDHDEAKPAPAKPKAQSQRVSKVDAPAPKPMKREFKVGSPAWNQAVARLACGEAGLRENLNNYFDITPELAKQLDEAVAKAKQDLEGDEDLPEA